MKPPAHQSTHSLGNFLLLISIQRAHLSPLYFTHLFYLNANFREDKVKYKRKQGEATVCELLLPFAPYFYSSIFLDPAQKFGVRKASLGYK